MDVAGLSHERGARASATPRSANTRDRRGRRAHTAAAARAESARHGHETLRPAPAAGALAAPDTADELQADYFVRRTQARPKARRCAPGVR